MIHKGILFEDKVISVRFVELIITLSQLDSTFGSKVSDSLRMILNLYLKEEDILFKVSLIEMITQMCTTGWNSTFIVQENFIENVLE